MIRRISDFMITPVETVRETDGLRQARELFLGKDQDCFPVTENGQVLGILRWQDILQSHPNRIAADAMYGRFSYAEPDMPFWQAKEIMEQNDLAALLIGDRDAPTGLVTPTAIQRELGRHTDLLTGLGKADYLYYKVRQMLAAGQQISIIFTDIDKFGYLNKQYGHAKGDVILKEISAILQANTPPEANLCRFGGDEFIVLMPCDRNAAAAFAQKLEQTVAEYVFTDHIPVTMTAGVVIADGMNGSASEHDHFLASLMNQASLASTLAKKDKEAKSVAYKNI